MYCYKVWEDEEEDFICKWCIKLQQKNWLTLYHIHSVGPTHYQCHHCNLIICDEGPRSCRGEEECQIMYYIDYTSAVRSEIYYDTDEEFESSSDSGLGDETCFESWSDDEISSD